MRTAERSMAISRTKSEQTKAIDGDQKRLSCSADPGLYIAWLGTRRPKDGSRPRRALLLRFRRALQGGDPGFHVLDFNRFGRVRLLALYFLSIKCVAVSLST